MVWKWSVRGLALGTVLGLAEALAMVVTGGGIPYGYALGSAYFDAVLLAIVGLVIGGFLQLRRAPVEDRIAPAFVLLAIAGVTVYGIGKAIHATSLRGMPSWVAVIGFFVALAAVAWVVSWAVSRITRSEATDASLMVGFVLLVVFLVGIFSARRSMLQDRSPVALIVVSVGLTALVLAGWLLFDRRFAATPAALRFRLLPFTVALLLATPALLFGVTQLRAATGTQVLESEGNVAIAAEDRRPHVILISIDTLRSDHLSAYGYHRNTSPNIDRFAERSVVFEDALSSSSWTVPGHATMLTGKFPVAHGAHGVAPPEWSSERVDSVIATSQIAYPLASANVTLAEVVADAGYRTAAIVGNGVNLNRCWGFDQGFQHYDDRIVRAFVYTTLLHDFIGYVFPKTSSRLKKNYRTATELNDDVFAWLDTRGAGPFFLFVNYMDPHTPYAPPTSFENRIPVDDGRTDDGLEALRPAWRDSLRETRRMYDGEIAFVDHEIGRLFDELKRIGLFEESLIIVTSDHGEFLGEHDYAGHSIGPFEEVYRVPLIVKYPGSRDVGARSHRVQIVDIMPTILDEIGLPAQPGIAGAVLGTPREPIITEQYLNHTAIRLAKRLGNRVSLGYRAIYEGQWKLVQYSDGTAELYDLYDDPREVEERASDRPDVVARLLSDLESWLDGTEKMASPDPEDEMDPKLLEQLRALGYL